MAVEHDLLSLEKAPEWSSKLFKLLKRSAVVIHEFLGPGKGPGIATHACKLTEHNIATFEAREKIFSDVCCLTSDSHRGKEH